MDVTSMQEVPRNPDLKITPVPTNSPIPI